ncbi:hypothetical protein [Propionispora hippei]|uniref:Trm112 family protein n=1 Tax=Propionispora hippei DSM 15287 TaxID=1123003 RepID=A0A1M6G7D8_9FIRM|nr:hypothetical protein [Propionispora hippei]SHJ05727.1 hypothetical protein SAMN02745170_01648 [Propionispora hippei DSM 15287]
MSQLKAICPHCDSELVKQAVTVDLVVFKCVQCNREFGPLPAACTQAELDRVLNESDR